MGVIGKTFRFTLGLALGAGIGTAAAFLLAPRSGKVSRDQLQERLDAIVRAGKEAQRQRERELQAYWEQEINAKGDDSGSKK